MFRKKSPDSTFDAIAASLDSLLDATFYKLAEHLGNFWAGYSAALGRWHVTGLRRVLTDLTSDAVTFGTAIAFLVLYYAIPPINDSEDVWHLGRQYAVTFTDVNGEIIGRRGIRQNDALRLEEIPAVMINAVLATEDQRFYDHIGLDFQGTTRAMIENLRANDVVQGGSTITQQLAKNLFLTPDKTLKRKLNEAMLALWIELRRTKPEILKLYLDRAYLGGGTYGVEAAAQFYFGKSIRNVTLAEAAMLAGLFKAPSKYAPHVNIQAARGRAGVVLDRMVASGFISQGEAFAAKHRPAKFVKEVDPLAPNFYLDWAYTETLKTLKAHNLEKEYVVNVTTTIDLKLQRSAQAIVNNILDTQGRPKKARQAALVSMTPEGAVKVIVGGRDYEASQFNRATNAKRQPGSSFKPIVYLMALRQGLTPRTVIVDRPISIGNWSPKNYSHSYRGPVTLMTALTRSINTIPVQLSMRFGRAKIIDTARRVGLQSKLISTPSMPLGTSEVTVLDLTTAYATFANDGKRVTPYAVLDIKRPSGELLYDRAQHARPQEQTVEPKYVRTLNKMLNNVVLNGTGRRTFMKFMPSAGKTGTTSAYRDAWFMGFTNYHVTGVWFGNDNYNPMARVTGGSLPAQTWREFNLRALEGRTIAGLPGVPVSNIYAAAEPAQEPASDEALLSSTRRRKTVHPAINVLRGLNLLFKAAQKDPSSDDKPQAQRQPASSPAISATTRAVAPSPSRRIN